LTCLGPELQKIRPTAVSDWPSLDSRTQPVPSIAACLAGSVGTPKMASSEPSMMVAVTLLRPRRRLMGWIPCP
jgi:hypothetical protein